MGRASSWRVKPSTPCAKSSAQAGAARIRIRKQVQRRLTAYLTVQGFLLAALLVPAMTLATQPFAAYRWLLALLLAAVPVAGFLSSWLAATLLHAGHRHIRAAVEWWDGYRADASY